jgi:hypothetical protein
LVTGRVLVIGRPTTTRAHDQSSVERLARHLGRAKALAGDPFLEPPVGSEGGALRCPFRRPALSRTAWAETSQARGLRGQGGVALLSRDRLQGSRLCARGGSV